MKNKILAAAIFLLPLGLFVYFWRHADTAGGPAGGEGHGTTDVAVARALASANPRATAMIASNFAETAQTVFYTPVAKPALAPAGKPAPLEYTNLPPEIVLANVSHAVHDYGSRFGGNPVGVNSEIASQLHGANPKQVDFLQPEAGMRLNAAGELVDPWGTPFFFHQLSGTEMEIHSAGPDQIMWTEDDLVTR